MHHPVGSDINPRPVVEAILRNSRPPPRCAGVRADPDRNLAPFGRFPIEEHRYKVKRPIARDCEVDIRVADRAIGFGADVQAAPCRAAINTLPKRWPRFAVSGDEQRSVRMLDDHRLAADDVNVIDALRENEPRTAR